ncbi:hypothetical protein BT93_L1489 [Corymbia citriodora subsp. variegata]|uniref:Haloacid dehalogenase-like hydrolase n=1 Tax=Corymbia citriodora subsp. variegata TaxID=360336 RepID=A0A8T0CE70_CORYI|nr:hypothetical protein BT93_L1489 [Corymbia citriodora subsp. variegata]
MAVLGNLPKQPKLTWQEIVDAYAKDYDKYMKTPYPWQSYNSHEYREWLAARKTVEQKSAQRVQEAEFFKGVTFDEVENSVKKHLADGSLQLRQGWAELFQAVLKSNDSRISIVSVNWSETSIRLTLLLAARGLVLPEQDHIELTRYIQSMTINANEIAGLREPGGSSGQICRLHGEDIRTSNDKLRYLPKPDESNVFVIYVGDSSTDFDCLVDADLGVWLCNVPESERQQKFKDTFAPFDQSGFYPSPLAAIRRFEDATELFYWSPDFEPLLRLFVADSQA